MNSGQMTLEQAIADWQARIEKLTVERDAWRKLVMEHNAWMVRNGVESYLIDIPPELEQP